MPKSDNPIRRAIKKEPEKSKKQPRTQKLSFNKTFITKDGKLSPQEIILCEAYMRNGCDMNAAAKEAGYKSIKAGVKVFEREDIQDYIYDKLERTYEDVTDNRVLKEINRIGFAKITDVMRWNNKELVIFPSETLSPDVAAAVQEVNFEETEYAGKGGAPGKIVRKVRVKLYPNKMEALKLQASMRGMLNQEGRLDAGEIADKIKDAMDNVTSGYSLPTMPTPEEEFRKTQSVPEENVEPISDLIKH